MISTLNRVTLTGRLTKDPIVKSVNSSNGTTNVANFTLAVDRNFKNRDGQYGTDFIRCSAWNQNADYAKHYVKKGSLVYVDGSIRTRRETDKNDPKQSRFYTGIHVENLGLLEHKSNNQNSDSNSASESSASSATNSKSTQSKSSNNSSESSSSSSDSDDDDDLPF